jgi:hypothetical protein
MGVRAGVRRRYARCATEARASRNCREWHLASIRTDAVNGRYWRHSGHWSALALNASVAIDPKQTLHRVLTAAGGRPISARLLHSRHLHLSLSGTLGLTPGAWRAISPRVSPLAANPAGATGDRCHARARVDMKASWRCFSSTRGSHFLAKY